MKSKSFTNKNKVGIAGGCAAVPAFFVEFYPVLYVEMVVNIREERNHGLITGT